MARGWPCNAEALRSRPLLVILAEVRTAAQREVLGRRAAQAGRTVAALGTPVRHNPMRVKREKTVAAGVLVRFRRAAAERVGPSGLAARVAVQVRRSVALRATSIRPARVA